MIANIWPEGSHVEETASTMHFCRRMMKVTNNPEINYHLDPQLLLRKYETEINDLKLELKMHDTLKGRGTNDYDEPSPDEMGQMEKMIKQYLTGDPEVKLQDLCSDATTIRHHKHMFQIFKDQYEKREAELRERQAMRPDDVEGGVDGGAAGEDTGADDQGVGVEEAGGEAGFSLGFAGENNRPPEDQEGAEGEGASPRDRDPDAGPAPAPRAEKSELFIAFKEKEQGREIEGQFKQLKADLKDAKSTLAQLAKEVNMHKHEIDTAQAEFDKTVGPAPKTGDIIDNDEWKAQQKLREKKKAYREKFDQHTQQRRIIEDIEGKIKQCKVNLVNAFESWWQQTYGTTQRDGDGGGVLDDLQDIGEQFDSMELDRMERIHPSGAVPFFKARKEFRLHHGTRSMR